MSLGDLSRYELATPGTLAELCGLLAARREAGERTVLLAGGTDVMVQLGTAPPSADPLPLVVDVARLDELRGVDWDGRELRVGAAATYREIERDPAIRQHAPLLARVCREVGGPTIQARGTLGGNLAAGSPAADGAAAVSAYDAVVALASVRGRRLVPFADYQTGYRQSVRAADEVIVAIHLVPPPAGSPWYWRKVGTRRAQAISKVAVAAVAELADGRVSRFGCAMASVGPVTATMPTLRRLVLAGPLASLTAAAVAAAVAADISPIDDLRSTRAYRLHCAQVLTRAALAELGAPV